MSFLKAEWRRLVLANYRVPAEVLTTYLPAGTELDVWNGKVLVSLVGFMFQNTKLKGMRIPFHHTFEEVNLRFYVRRFEKEEWRRGVVFIKEIVPKRAITFIANTVYGEHYETLPMNHNWKIIGDDLFVQYTWKKNNEWNEISVEAANVQQPIAEGSEEEFILEHYWGFTKHSEKKSSGYEVRHPRWNIYPVKEFTVRTDFAKVYGNDFAFLNELQPDSVFLAEGSEISVEDKIKIRT